MDKEEKSMKCSNFDFHTQPKVPWITLAGYWMPYRVLTARSVADRAADSFLKTECFLVE